MVDKKALRVFLQHGLWLDQTCSQGVARGTEVIVPHRRPKNFFGDQQTGNSKLKLRKTVYFA